MMTTALEREPATTEEITIARAYYQDDDVEIDDDAVTSRADADAGRWVSAWVWVSDEMIADPETVSA